MCDENESGMIPLSEDDVRYNGGQRCDMKVGPCACGAWHSEKEKTKIGISDTTIAVVDTAVDLTSYNPGIIAGTFDAVAAAAENLGEVAESAAETVGAVVGGLFSLLSD